jgi:hypothetical protein
VRVGVLLGELRLPSTGSLVPSLTGLARLVSPPGTPVPGSCLSRPYGTGVDCGFRFAVMSEGSKCFIFFVDHTYINTEAIQLYCLLGDGRVLLAALMGLAGAS